MTASKRDSMTPFLKSMTAVIWKDLTVEWHSHELLIAMLIFAMIVLFIFNFALELDPKSRSGVTSGVLWVTFAFAGTIGLNRSLAMEKDHGCLDGLLLAPVDRTALFLGKFLANWVFTLVVALVLVPLAGFFYGVNPFHWQLLGVVLLGTLGYSLAGILIATLSQKLSSRELYLPILLFPVLIPLLMAAIRATQIIITGSAAAELITWLGMLTGFDILILAVGILLFEPLVSE